MRCHERVGGPDPWQEELERCDADDEGERVPMDGYHKAIIQGWTPLWDIADPQVHGGNEEAREGEEDPRCPTYSAQKLAVALNLNKHERMTNTDAIAACAKEWEKLRATYCWDEYDVGQSATQGGTPRTRREKPREWADVTREYRKMKKCVHIGYLDELCMLKGSELEDGNELKKMKGRVVFRGNQVWTATSEKAIFEEANCTPADMLAAKTADAWGCMRGHVCQQADANQAYTQAPFVGGTDTYVRLPENR